MTAALRDATLADLDAIMAIETATFPTDAWSRAAMQDELRSPHSRYVLLEEGGAVIGYAGLRAVAGDPQADIQTIAVAEPARGRGLGRELMEHLVAEAVAAGAIELFLEVRVDNAPARGLYQSLGFEEIGIRPRYYQPDGVDAAVMRLNLPVAGEEGR